MIESGDGLRIENSRNSRIALVFPDGVTVWIASGKAVTVLKPCPERLPVRAETGTGILLGEYDAPCRRRDTWVVS